MDNRIGVIGIVIEDIKKSSEVNSILHVHSNMIIGRMGVPYKEKKVSAIALLIDGTADEVSSLTGKLGKVNGIQVKSALTKV